MKHLTRDDAEAYLARMGKLGEKTLSTLGKLQPFAECMETQLGFDMLCEWIQRYEDLLDKVCELTATDEEKIELKVLKGILIKYAGRINMYNRKLAEIKGERPQRKERE